MAPDYGKFVRKGKSFIRDVAVELDAPDDETRAYRVFRSVLHTLRSKVSPQESIQLIAQLPMFIKAMYVDGWKWSSRNSKIRTMNDFIQAVGKENQKMGYRDFKGIEQVELAVAAVMRVLARHVSEGELNDIASTLPTELKPLLSNDFTWHQDL
ncbi:MAG: DUF2267 domain-containing protein [Saprospiraceae bacterium]|nr:DUF2267 domain-containing protein [Saprospiraceae bacterium]